MSKITTFQNGHFLLDNNEQIRVPSWIGVTTRLVYRSGEPEPPPSSEGPWGLYFDFDNKGVNERRGEVLKIGDTKDRAKDIIFRLVFRRAELEFGYRIDQYKEAGESPAFKTRLKELMEGSLK